MAPSPRQYTQEDIDAAASNPETKPLPSTAAKAYEMVRPSVARVQGLVGGPIGEDIEVGVGTGVVIVDKGIILTNLHVVIGAERIKVRFFDGMESEATVIGVRPEHDLACFRPKPFPTISPRRPCVRPPISRWVTWSLP
jgi:S1-C subfamily serine protease